MSKQTLWPLSSKLSPELRSSKGSAISPSTSLNLHLDDINEQDRSSRDAKETAQSPNFPGRANDTPPSPFRSKTKEHIKLFKQYLSTCQQNGVNCSLDPESASDSSDTSEEQPPRFLHRRGSAYTINRPTIKLDSFLSRPRSSSFTGPLSSDNGRGNDSGASRTPSQTSAPSRSDSPALSFRGTPSSSSLQLPHLGAQDEAVSGMYKSQVATALGAGRAVWL